ncbi:MAG: hypothetical protein UR26_C0004G0033 [candidate division TM6 bacterium GW2011_GWF2_32_72]|nr:MAG: hypothetical protein UR26_C0004G0033 [candidate division TM6 bacterium GW2011_GWF2_32_72]
MKKSQVMVHLLLSIGIVSSIQTSQINQPSKSNTTQANSLATQKNQQKESKTAVLKAQKVVNPKQNITVLETNYKKALQDFAAEKTISKNQTKFLDTLFQKAKQTTLAKGKVTSIALSTQEIQNVLNNKPSTINQETLEIITALKNAYPQANITDKAIALYNTTLAYAAALSLEKQTQQSISLFIGKIDQIQKEIQACVQ